MSMRLRISRIPVTQLQDVGLKEEAEAWMDDGESVIAGQAVPYVDDGSGPLEGFFRESSGKGMVVWGEGGEASDWIEAGSLEEMFRLYVQE